MELYSEDIVEINIKNLKNIYEIYLNKCVLSYKTIKVYEGKNILTNEKILVDVYNYDIILLAKRIKNKIIKIDHKNIINIIDIVIEMSLIYIIKPHIDLIKLNNSNIQNNLFLSVFDTFKNIVKGIKYLFDKNIDIEPILIDHIFIYNNENNENIIKVYPFFSENSINNNKFKILYGSPVYILPEIFAQNKNEKENILILNLGIILYQIINKIKFNYITNNINININIRLNIDENNEFYDILVKMLNIHTQMNNRISLQYIFEYFNENKIINCGNDNKIKDEFFVMEM